MSPLQDVLSEPNGRGFSKSEQAYRFLRQGIIAMQMPPGSILNEKDVCETLSFSRTPVREAILRLGTEGLLAIVPSGGTFVSRISLHGVLQGLIVRSSLELSLTERAAQNYTAADGRRFDLLDFLQRDAHANQDFDQALQVDDAFHRLICTLAGFPDVWDIICRASGQLDRVRRFSYERKGLPQEVEQEHRRIHDALRRADAAEARALMTRHLEDIGQAIETLRDTHPDLVAAEGTPF